MDAQFKNEVAEAFYDAMSFRDARHGFALSDAVAGQLVVSFQLPTLQIRHSALNEVDCRGVGTFRTDHAAVRSTGAPRVITTVCS